jgi:hypothetical protein
MRKYKPNPTGIAIKHGAPSVPATEFQALRIGKIKIGTSEEIPGKTGKRPIKLDHFRATGMYANQFDLFVKSLRDPGTGDPLWPDGKAKTLKIVFPFDDPSRECYQQYEVWDKGKLFGRGDGYSFEIWDENKGDYRLIQCFDQAGNALPEDPLLTKFRNMKGPDGKPAAKARLHLCFAIVGLPISGFWELETGGVETSMHNLISSYNFVRKTLGTVRMIPFDLHVQINKSHSPGATRQYNMLTMACHLDPDTMGMLSENPHLTQGNRILTPERVQLLTTGLPEAAKDVLQRLEPVPERDMEPNPAVDTDYAEFEELDPGLEILNDYVKYAPDYIREELRHCIDKALGNYSPSYLVDLLDTHNGDYQQFISSLK